MLRTLSGTVAGIGLMLAAAIVHSCSRASFVDDTWDLESPSGELQALVLRSDFVGAASSYNYSIVLIPKGEYDPLSPGREPVWKSSGCPPTYVIWLDDQRLAILVEGSNPRCLNEPFRDVHTENGVAVQTALLAANDWGGIRAAMARLDR